MEAAASAARAQHSERTTLACERSLSCSILASTDSAVLSAGGGLGVGLFVDGLATLIDLVAVLAAVAVARALIQTVERRFSSMADCAMQGIKVQCVAQLPG